MEIEHSRLLWDPQRHYNLSSDWRPMCFHFISLLFVTTCRCPNAPFILLCKLWKHKHAFTRARKRLCKCSRWEKKICFINGADNLQIIVVMHVVRWKCSSKKGFGGNTARNIQMLGCRVLLLHSSSLRHYVFALKCLCLSLSQKHFFLKQMCS